MFKQFLILKFLVSLSTKYTLHESSFTLLFEKFTLNFSKNESFVIKSVESLKSQLEAINYELQNLIELSEIVEFKPDEDSKFSKAKGVSDKFTEKDTSDLNKVGKIAEIISPGYKINRLDSSDDEIIIKESIVSVYVNKNEINDKLGENNE